MFGRQQDFGRRRCETSERGPELVGLPLEERFRQTDFELAELSDLLDVARVRGERLDAAAVAHAWLDQVDGVESIRRFVDIVMEDPDTDPELADSWVLALRLSAVSRDVVRDELAEVFAESVSVEAFEEWTSGSTAGTHAFQVGVQALDGFVGI